MTRYPLVVPTSKEVIEAAKMRVIAAYNESLRMRGEFHLVLAGGQTPKVLYEQLVTANIDWTKVFVYFGDERYVPLDDPQSNAHMADEALLYHVPIPNEQVFRFDTALEPESSAKDYEDRLHASMGDRRFDLTLLGMGDDGHTASLFPGTDALTVKDRWVVANPVAKLNAVRLTMTYPRLNHSDNVLFLVVGANKGVALAQVFRGGDVPAGQVSAEYDVMFLVDQEAARAGGIR